MPWQTSWFCPDVIIIFFNQEQEFFLQDLDNELVNSLWNCSLALVVLVWSPNGVTFGNIRDINHFLCWIVLREHRYVFTFCIISPHGNGTCSWKSSLIKDNDPFIQHTKYYDFWWPGDRRSQIISSYGIYIVLLEYFGLSTRNFNCTKLSPWNIRLSVSLI